MSPRWFYGHIFEKKLREDIRKRNRLMQEYRALLHFVPVNEPQMKWICNTLDMFESRHPELEQQIIQALDEFSRLHEIIEES